MRGSFPTSSTVGQPDVGLAMAMGTTSMLGCLLTRVQEMPAKYALQLVSTSIMGPVLQDSAPLTTMTLRNGYRMRFHRQGAQGAECTLESLGVDGTVVTVSTTLDMRTSGTTSLVMSTDMNASFDYFLLYATN